MEEGLIKAVEMQWKGQGKAVERQWSNSSSRPKKGSVLCGTPEDRNRAHRVGALVRPNRGVLANSCSSDFPHGLPLQAMGSPWRRRGLTVAALAYSCSRDSP